MDSRGKVFAAAIVLGLAVLIAYANSYRGPLLYDDLSSIVTNPTIRDLTAVQEVLSPPASGGKTVGGRPFLNFTLALNYAMSGTGVWSYHVLNIAIHLAAALTLFGIVRRVLVSRAVGQSGSRAVGQSGSPEVFAFIAALLWAVHPLQTESITYIVQRAESLMGLLFLQTLYAFIRAVENPKSRTWPAWCVTACLLGVGTKEIIVCVPVLIFLFDRTFFAGSFREAWRLRRRLHVALACTWIPLALLVASTGGNRGGSIGLGIGLDWWNHSLTQFRAVSRYLWLSFWPHPLVFDYGPERINSALEVLPYVAVVGVAAWVTLRGLWRGTAVGFAGAWFFAILSPTSLLTGATQMTVEHRMYLPLAAVVVLVTAGLHSLFGRRALVAGLVIATALGARTIVRNADYRTEVAIWEATAASRPGNVTAQNEYGGALMRAGRMKEAVAVLEDVIRRHPESASAHHNLGVALFIENRTDESLAILREAIRLNPKSGEVRANLASALLQKGQADEAVAAAREAVRLAPEFADAHTGLGTALLVSGKLDAAAPEFQEALRLEPNSAETHFNFANLLIQLRSYPEAIGHLRDALRLEPAGTDIRRNLGAVLVLSGKREEGVVILRGILRLDPGDRDTRAILERIGEKP